MHISLITHYLKKSSGFGIARYSSELYEGLIRDGVAVDCVCAPYIAPSPIKSGFDFFFYLPMISLIPRAKTDICHVAMQQAGFVIPILKKIHRKKVVTTIHDVNPIIFPSSKSSLLLKRAIEISAKESDLVIADSIQTKNDIISRYKIEKNKIEVIPLGVDKRFKHIEGKERKGFTVGYVGGFAKHKDVPYLLRAFALFEKKSLDSTLVLYGKGSQIQECKDLAMELGIRNVEFKGFAPEEELVEIYNSFDVFVFPSEYEGFGLPILEAQKCNVPVIVKEKAHLSEEITRHCLMAKDEEHMAEMIYEIATQGFEFDKSHQDYLDEFTWEKCIEKTIAAYKKCLSK